MYDNLVGGLEHEFYGFPYIGNVIIPTDELHHFSEGFAATTKQLLMGILWHKWGYDGDIMGIE